MFQVAVNATVGHQTKQVQRSASRLNMLDCSRQDLVGEESFVADRACDPHHFLVHDSAGTDVLVSHFAVSHHPGGQSNILAGSVNQGMGVISHQCVGDRRFCQMDGVGVIPLGIRVFAPTVTDNQDNRFSADLRHGDVSSEGRLVIGTRIAHNLAARIDEAKPQGFRADFLKLQQFCRSATLQICFDHVAGSFTPAITNAAAANQGRFERVA
jgi:hypothetical protein